jgi:hypothetical protein
MGMECGEGGMEIPTLENGGIQRLKGMECTFGRMEIDTKENGEDA